MGKINIALLKAGYTKDEIGIYISGNSGYWSNMDKYENQELMELLKIMSPCDAVRKLIPNMENQIFSVKREAALELLNVKEGSICIDYGCMWGVLSIGMAKRGSIVVSIDQTYDSLRFLCARIKHEGLDNIICVQDDIRKIDMRGLSDYAIVNGVLEWVPEVGDVELKKYYGKKLTKKYPSISPALIQANFLKQVNNNLKKDGKLLIAIENRYDYAQFIGLRDPHSNLLFTSFLPRSLSNAISRIILDRPYVNYLYSFKALKKLLLSSGFREAELYMAFPHYHAPVLLLPYETGINKYKKYWALREMSWKQKIRHATEYILMKYLKGKFFAPSIVAIAKK